MAFWCMIGGSMLCLLGLAYCLGGMAGSAQVHKAWNASREREWAEQREREQDQKLDRILRAVEDRRTV
jgi:hypothetical protein